MKAVEFEETFQVYTMATKHPLKTTFEVEKVIQPIFTGGSVGIDNGARVLATTLGEDAVLTDLTTGKRLALIEGVRSPNHSFQNKF